MDEKMDRKTGKRRGLSAIAGNNKGMETRVLIYILAAVVLVAAIGIALQAIGVAGELGRIANQYSAAMMKNSMGGEGKIPEGVDDPTQIEGLQKPAK